MTFFLILCFFSVSAQSPSYSNLYEKNGKIGIGTSEPDELLTVKGTIHTREVKVDLDGAVAPDFVFEKYFTGSSVRNPEYEIPSLKDLEIFIEKHHHLPHIPPASHMEESGISLKEMNLLLLQKIEELTLYTIQQQKEIDRLKEKINTEKQ